MSVKHLAVINVLRNHLYRQEKEKEQQQKNSNEHDQEEKQRNDSEKEEIRQRHVFRFNKKHGNYTTIIMTASTIEEDNIHFGGGIGYNSNNNNKHSYGNKYSPNSGNGYVDLYPSVHTGNTNVAFCGVMVVSIIVAVIAMCYCCHKGGRKRENEMLTSAASLHSHSSACRWRYGSSTLPLHIYTIEGHQFCGGEGGGEELVMLSDIRSRSTTNTTFNSMLLPLSPSPPPEYESVIGSNINNNKNGEINNINNNHFNQPIRNVINSSSSSGRRREEAMHTAEDATETEEPISWRCGGELFPRINASSNNNNNNDNTFNISTAEEQTRRRQLEQQERRARGIDETGLPSYDLAITFLDLDNLNSNLNANTTTNHNANNQNNENNNYISNNNNNNNINNNRIMNNSNSQLASSTTTTTPTVAYF